MLGLDTLQAAFEACRHRRWQMPFLCGLAWVLFTGITAGGFLWLVGIHPYASALAFVPSVALLLGFSVAFWGAVWSSLALDASDSWRDWVSQGLQFALYHAMWGAFVLSLGYLMLPWGALLVLFYAVMLPTGILPMVLSARNRSIFGLLEASLRVFQIPFSRLVLLWAELFAYCLFWGLLIFPLACVGLLLSIVGIPLIPVSALIFVQGSITLVQNALEEVSFDEFAPQSFAPQPAYSTPSWPTPQNEGFRRFNSSNPKSPE